MRRWAEDWYEVETLLQRFARKSVADVVGDPGMCLRPDHDGHAVPVCMNAKTTFAGAVIDG